MTRCHHTPTNPLRSGTPAHATSAVLCGRPHGDQKAVGEGAQLDNIMDYFAAHEVDIGVIQEPGKVAGNKEQIQRWAGEEGRNYEALVYGEVGDEVRTGGVARGVPLANAGCIVLLRGGWAGACTNRGVIAGAAEESSRDSAA